MHFYNSLDATYKRCQIKTNQPKAPLSLKSKLKSHLVVLSFMSKAFKKNSEKFKAFECLFTGRNDIFQDVKACNDKNYIK